jgi:hypothetical protein
MALARSIAVVTAAVVAVTGLAGTVAANPVKSLYTPIDLKDCRQTTRHKDGGAWTCKGLAGYPIHVAEGDLRTFVSVGPGAASRRAATQTLATFNSIFQAAGSRATLEWRFERKGERQVPYATILRYFTESDGRRGEVLVVTRVTDKEACHLGYVDALANPEAIALARALADEKARTFDCRSEPLRVGVRGRSPL